LLLEGNKAKSRRLLLKLMDLLVKIKLRNQKSLAFGIWKIHLLEHQSLAKRPKYAKVASCHLIVRWFARMIVQNIRNWFVKWKEKVVRIIFHERYAATIIIQTLYRRIRDKKRVVEMHKVAPYLGIFSDIFLPKERTHLRFRMPTVIRRDKRMYYLAATKIQTLFRCYIECKEYFLTKRRVILIQSVCRMFPKRKYYVRLRATTIKCQAWVRRTQRRKVYLILRAQTIIIQKYIRRYLAILWKERTFLAIWSQPEQEWVAAIRIQCRYRIRLARRKVKFLRYQKALKQYAALVIQRNYFRYRKQFHTFFLMCVLSAREKQDYEYEELATTMGRQQCARRIQRYYHMRYFKRNIYSVIKVQCWFRGRLGYNLVTILRKKRWAERKLRHWAKVYLKRRHKFIRKIQFWWLRLQPYRMLKHLWYRQKQADMKWIAERRRKYYDAACIIQAIVRGRFTRWYIERLKAALLIQKNYRFWRGIRTWKSLKRERILKDVRKYVTKVLAQGLANATQTIVNNHIQLLTKPQAWIRGFIIRKHFKVAKEYAKKLSNSVLIIQRFWTKSNLMLKAVEEVMAKKRMEKNPFRLCTNGHTIFDTLTTELSSYYSYYDPRVGMKCSELVYRVGAMECIDLFPKRSFTYVKDLAASKWNMDKLTELYDLSQQRKRMTGGGKGNNAGKGGAGGGAAGGGGGGGAGGVSSSSKKGKNTLPGHIQQQLQTILDVITMPYHKFSGTNRVKLQELKYLSEYMPPLQLYDNIKKIFLKKFGKHLLTRCENYCKELLETIYGNYYNSRLFNYTSLTIHQIQKSIAVTSADQSGNIFQNLEDIVKNSLVGSTLQNLTEEKKYHLERLKHTSSTLQLAMDRLLEIFPNASGDDGDPTMSKWAKDALASMNNSLTFHKKHKVQKKVKKFIPIRQELEKLNYRIALYRKKSAFYLKKIQMQQQLQQQQAEAKKAAGIPARKASPKQRPTQQTPAKDKPSAVAPPGKSVPSAPPTKTHKTHEPAKEDPAAFHPDFETVHGILPELPHLDAPIAPEDILDVIYQGPDMEFELDYYTTLCQLLGSALEKFMYLNRAIQQMKIAWNNKRMKRVVMQERKKQFLSTMQNMYLEEQQQNKVRDLWNRHKKQEKFKKQYEMIILHAQERKQAIVNALSYVPRYHIQNLIDPESGYPYYIDEKGESSYDMPLYSIQQWYAALKMQAVARKYIERQYEKARIKAEEERQALLLAEQQMNIERKKMMKAIHLELPLKAMRVKDNLLANAHLAAVSAAAAFINERNAAAAAAAAALAAAQQAAQAAAAAEEKNKKGGKGKSAPPPTPAPAPIPAAALTPAPVSTVVAMSNVTTVATTSNTSNKQRSNEKSQKPAKTLEEEIEESIPRSYRFITDILNISGIWALYFTPNPNPYCTSPVLSPGNMITTMHGTYEIVIIFHLRPNEGLCDMRTVKGHITNDIPLKRIKHMPYLKGMVIEARYRYRKLFYRGQINYIYDFCNSNQIKYKVKYADGETEGGLQRDGIRPILSTVLEWLTKRYQFYLVAK
jgi:hypothetical protein